MTVGDAQAEGSEFARTAMPDVVPALFGARPFGGSSERRCVSSVPDDSLPGGSLRSGEVIVRARFTSNGLAHGLQAERPSKVLWLPLHAPQHGVVRGYSLLLRAVRVGDPADTLRRIIPGVTRGGFPSSMLFPKPGQWLVVATSGADWGCFVLRVEDGASRARSSR